MNSAEFPVLEQLNEILNSIAKQPITILQAPPGSGKTTALPLEILGADILKNKKILMLEPRRIATKNAALRLSQLNQTKTGEEIGYRIRFDTKVSENSKLEVVTDGILTKLLLADPELKKYGLIIFDEFHERNLDSDFCLSLARRVQSHFREDLKILIMSATLEGIKFRDAGINSNPIIAEGKSYPVEIIYQGDSNKRQSIRLAELIPKALEKHEGDLLVFFAGVSEINEVSRELSNIFQKQNTIIHRLFGDMTFEDQERVFLPAKQGQKKVILATNLAESSVTIPNVRIVIDTGYCKRAIFEPSSGLTKLVKKRISLASAKQRSGRSGREAPGFAYRLWSKEEESNFVTAHPPEILETDISNLILLSKLWGEEITELPLIDCPSDGVLLELTELLQRLGCLSPSESLTELGKRAAQLPIPLRLAVMCLRLIESGKLAIGVDLALSLTERRLFSDYMPLQNFSQIWDKWTSQPNLQLIPKLKLMRDQLTRSLTDSNSLSSGLRYGPNETSPGQLLSLAYPDRISKSRSPNSNRYKMSNGKGAFLPESSMLQFPDWILILESDGNDTDSKITLYCELVEEDVLSLHANQITTIVTNLIEENDKKVPILRSYEEKMLGEISIKKTTINGKNYAEGKKQSIKDYLLKRGIFSFLLTNEETKQFCHRIHLLFKNGILKKDIDESFLMENLETWLFPNYNFEKENLNLFDFTPIDALLSLFTYQEKELINKEVPTHLTVPSGSKIKIDYIDGNPILAVKLQELFGLSQTPHVAQGRVPVTLHLLSPAGRPVQITTDLKNFWDTTYHEVKKELKGRYPKHPWPDSPWDAIASRGTKKRSLN